MKSQKNDVSTMPKTRIEESGAIVIDFSKDKIIEDFLNAQKKSTKMTYSTYMKRLLEFTQQNGRQILDDSEQWITKIFDFQKWLRSKGYSACYIQSCLGCLRGFFAHYRINLALNKQEKRKLNTKARKTTDYRFSREEILRMGETASLKERYVLYLGKSVGLRSIDFVSITYGMLRRLNLNEECPIGLGEMNTEKENVKAYPFLDSDAVSVIRPLLEANADKPDNERVFKSEREELSVILRRLAQKSGINSHGSRIRFHCLRAYLITRLSAVASESQWKQIIGKQIAESAYVSTEMLREVYAKAMPNISVTTNGFKSKQYEQTIADLEKENASLKQRIELLQKQLSNVADVSKELVKDKIDEESHAKVMGITEEATTYELDKWQRALRKLEGAES